METDLDAELIDAFDAEPAIADAAPLVDMQKPRLNVVQKASLHAPVVTSAPVVALRHYPSLDALGSPPTKTTPPPPAGAAGTRPVFVREGSAPSYRGSTPSESTVAYPRWLPTSADALIATPSHASGRTAEERNDSNDTSMGLPPPPRQDEQRSADSVENEHCDSRAYNSEVLLNGESSELNMRESPPRHIETPTDEEIARQQRLLQAEIKRFEAQADYIALALAGETPHQIEARRQREEERKEREERRLAALETRVLNVIEREQQREARQLERRLRHAERAHRSSVSPSPEREDKDPEEEPPQLPQSISNEP